MISILAVYDLCNMQEKNKTKYHMVWILTFRGHALVYTILLKPRCLSEVFFFLNFRDSKKNGK